MLHVVSLCFNIIPHAHDVFVSSWHKFKSSVGWTSDSCIQGHSHSLPPLHYCRNQWPPMWLIDFPKSVSPRMLHSHSPSHAAINCDHYYGRLGEDFQTLRTTVWHAALSLCHYQIPLSIGSEFWEAKHVLSAKTKSHYKLICRTKFPVLFFFFTWWRAPQQMLRTHHSLKAFCATCDEDEQFFTKFYK
jgi:hypothetical protein